MAATPPWPSTGGFMSHQHVKRKSWLNRVLVPALGATLALGISCGIASAATAGGQARAAGLSVTATARVIATRQAPADQAPAATQAEVPPGGEVAFELNVANAGPSDSQQVRVTDDLAPELEFVSGDDCTAAGQTVTCALGTLAAGDSHAFVITVRVKANTAEGTMIKNVATVGSATPDPDLANNTSNEATITVGDAEADLHAFKTGPPSITAGQDFTVTIGATNEGPSNATGVTVSDPLNQWLEFVSSDDTNCTYDNATHTVTCDFGDVADGATVMATLTLRPKPSTPADTVIENTATATATTLDPNPGSATVTIGLANADGKPPVGQSADLGISKSVVPGSVRKPSNP
jgi:large repetitive protein